MANTKISELQETTDLSASYRIPLAQPSGNINLSKKISSANFKLACKGDAGPAGSQFDCTVATTGGDYTTVTDALNAGKSNIFVKNGNYTETSWECSGKNAIITGQSMLGVVINFNNTSIHANSYLTCTGGTGLQISNITFNITFTGVNYYFVYTTTSFVGIPFKFSKCTFNIAQGVNPTAGSSRKLVSGTYIDMTYSSTIVTLQRSFENGFFDCYFYTNYDKGASDYAIAVATSGFNYFQGCRFTTDATAGTFNINGITILRNCFLDVFRYSGGSLALDNTTLSLKDGGSHSDSTGGPGANVSFYTVYKSYIKYNTSVVTSTGINIYYSAIDSHIDVLGINLVLGNVGVKSVSIGNYINTTGTITFSQCNGVSNNLNATTVLNLGFQDCMFCTNKIVGNFTADTGAFQSLTGNTITGNVTLPGGGSGNQSTFCSNHVGGTLTIGWRYCSITGNGITGNVDFTSNGYENAFTGNRCGTITIVASANYNVITGNQNGTITDGGTGTIKSGNRV